MKGLFIGPFFFLNRKGGTAIARIQGGFIKLPFFNLSRVFGENEWHSSRQWRHLRKQ